MAAAHHWYPPVAVDVAIQRSAARLALTVPAWPGRFRAPRTAPRGTGPTTEKTAAFSKHCFFSQKAKPKRTKKNFVILIKMFAFKQIRRKSTHQPSPNTQKGREKQPRGRPKMSRQQKTAKSARRNHRNLRQEKQTHTPKNQTRNKFTNVYVDVAVDIDIRIRVPASESLLETAEDGNML